MRHTPAPRILVALLVMPLLLAGCASLEREAAPRSGQAVEYRLDEDVVRSYTHPEGIDGTFVPAFVYEPAVNYIVPPRPEWADRLQPGPPPEPKRRGGRTSMRAPSAAVPASAVADRSMVEPRSSPAPVAGRVVDLAAPAPTLVVDFPSTTFTDNSANTGSLFIPPDSSGAAGPNHVVSVVNVTIQFHTKTGTPLLGDPATGISLESFFAPASPANFLFDPKVLYDQIAGRFVVVALEKVDDGVTESSRLLVAVSDDAEPLGTWFFTAVDGNLNIGGLDRWADYPGFALDEEAVYLTTNMFAFNGGGGGFGGVRMWVIDKFAGAGGGFYGGGTPTVLGPIDPYGGDGSFTGTTQPAHTYGIVPAGVGTWLSLYSGLTTGDFLPDIKGTEAVQVMRIDDPTGIPTTIVGPWFVDLGNIEDIGGDSGFPDLPDAPQAGTTVDIEVNDRRALDAKWSDDHLYLTTTIEPNSGADSGHTTAHWMDFDTTNLVTGPVSVDGGNLGGEDIVAGASTFFPAIAVTESGDVAVGFSASAATIFAGSYYSFLPWNSPPRVPVSTGTLRAGEDWYVRTFTGSSNRWGDYSALSIDPIDQCFWVFNQHAITRGTPTDNPPQEGRWQTHFGKFCTNREPAVTIALPIDAWLYAAGQSTSFLGTAIDFEEGDLTAGLDWTSDLDGVLGSGGSFSKVLSAGVHSISTEVTDSLGLTGSAQVGVIVISGCQPTWVLANMMEMGVKTYGAADSITFGNDYISTATADIEAWADVIMVKNNVEFNGTVTLGNIAGSTGCI